MAYPSIDSENEVQNINEFRVNGWVFEKIIIDNVKYDNGTMYFKFGQKYNSLVYNIITYLFY